MNLIRTNITKSYAYKTSTAQSRQIITFANYLDTVNLGGYMPQSHYALHPHVILNTSLTVVKYQHNTTPLICEKAFRSNRGNLTFGN